MKARRRGGGAMARGMKSRGHHDNLMSRQAGESSEQVVIPWARDECGTWRSKGDVNPAAASTSKCDFSIPRGRRNFDGQVRASDRSSRSLVDSCPRPSFLPQSFPTSSPEDEKCIKHYRHSVSCGGQYPPIERLSSLHSRFSTCVRVFPLLPRLWKTPAENESDYVSSFLTRLRWDLSRPSCPSILITLISFAANFFRNVLPLNLFAFAKKKISFLLFLKFLIT